MGVRARRWTAGGRDDVSPRAFLAMTVAFMAAAVALELLEARRAKLRVQS